MYHLLIAMTRSKKQARASQGVRIHVVTFDWFVISVNANDSSNIHCGQNIKYISKR